MARRNQGDLQEIGSKRSFSMSGPQSAMASLGHPNEKRLTWSYVLDRTYRLYARNFWTYFRIAIVPAIVAYLFGYVARLVRHRLLLGDIVPAFSGKWFALLVGIELVNGAVYCTISAFFFAAIAATFESAQTHDAPVLYDAYTLPRKRLPALFAVALLTWTLFYVGRSSSAFAIYGLLKRLGLERSYWVFSGSIFLMLLLLCGLLAKFALAIPALMHDTTLPAGSAIKKSLRQTEGWELFFMMFLAKSAMVGYAALLITNYILNFMWHHWTYSANLYSWFEWAAYICIAAALESPLFIAFSVLHQELQSGPADSPGDAASDEMEFV
jgi:hypothetical protein